MEHEHVHHVPGEDPQMAALREMINVNRRLVGINPPLAEVPPVLAQRISYEWGIRDHPTHGRDLWEDWHAVPPEPFTEKTARERARLGFWSGYQLLRRTPGGEPEIVEYRPAPMEPPTDADFSDVAPQIQDGVTVTLLGEDSETAAALGHVDPTAMAEAVTARLRYLYRPDKIEPFDPVNVQHVHAIRIDGEWGGDETGDWTLLWKWPDQTTVTATTHGAFPLTILDVSWRTEAYLAARLAEDLELCCPVCPEAIQAIIRHYLEITALQAEAGTAQ